MKINFSSIVNFFCASCALGAGIGYSHLYLFHFAFILFLLSWLYISSINGSTGLEYPRTSLYLILPIMFLWYSFGLIWSVDIAITLRYVVYILLGASTSLILLFWMNTKDRYHRVFTIVKSVLIVEIIVSLLEVFTQFRFPTSPYSQYSSYFSRSGGDLSGLSARASAYVESLPTGFMGNPNNLALLMVMLLPYFLFSNNKFVKLIGSIVIFTIIISAGSRGVFISAVIALVLCFLFTKIKYLLPAFLLCVIFSIVFYTNLDRLKNSQNIKIAEIAYTGVVLKDYLLGSDDGVNSISLRRQLIKNGFESFMKSGLIGLGGGGSQSIQNNYSNVSNLKSLHNFWLEVLFDSGIVFFVLFVVWYFIMILYLFIICLKTTSSFMSYHAKSLAVTFIVFSVGCISVSSVIYYLPMWFMFGMGLSLINLYDMDRGQTYCDNAVKFASY